MPGIRLTPTIAAGRQSGADRLTVDMDKAAPGVMKLMAALPIVTIVCVPATWVRG